MVNTHISLNNIDFIGIGAPRCGTTLLTTILSKHPDVDIPENSKELHYFDGRNYDLGLDWYHGFFKDISKIKGEFTPSYLRTKEAPVLINEYNPNIKLVVSFRNPVKRAISHYKYLITQGLVNSPFEEVLESRDFEVKNAGRYYSQLSNYLNHFDRNQIFILIFEKLLEDPEVELSKLCDFLGLNLDPKMLDFEKVNASYKPKNQWLSKNIRSLSRSLARNKILFNFIRHSGLHGLGKSIVRANVSKKEIDVNIPAKSIEGLHRIYKSEIEGIENLIGEEIEQWK